MNGRSAWELRNTWRCDDRQPVRSIAVVFFELVPDRQHQNKLRARDFVKSHVASGSKRDLIRNETKHGE